MKSPHAPQSELRQNLRWLINSRVIFTILLLCSTAFIHVNRYDSAFKSPLILLYGMIAALFPLSMVYAFIRVRVSREVLFAYIQIAIDCLVVTVVIFVTGSFDSIFSFLYLVVIIYTSMLLYRRGSMIIAGVCSLFYLMLAGLEYLGWIHPLDFGSAVAASHYDWQNVFYKIVITSIACFAVAFLSSLLAEQARRTRKELHAMSARMQRVEKMAAVGEMGAGLAHEIKNPLASITGSIQLLLEEMPYDAGRDKLMRIILREADRLSALVGNFLLFARPPSGKSKPISLDQAIPETVRLVEQDKRCRDRIAIRQSGQKGLWVAMDPDHFRQVLWNLLLNAVESIDGDGVVHVRVEPCKPKYVSIEIADSGCGITEKNLNYIFDPFYTSKPDGTGLGLSIVHTILESHDGWLEVESKAGQGTTFTIKLNRIASPPIA
ncbi:MAG: two-component sensor histidine kinase [Desulfobacteraceae bacterium]|nr:two-component sensor histidine kinase [Desulfobacteraceae bacterium]MBC2750508.1 two-component sensor histidine kinase [Desulfobacteraceae bacterium]